MNMPYLMSGKSQRFPGLGTVTFLAAELVLASCGTQAPSPPEPVTTALADRTRVVETEPLTIDGIHRSMDGAWQRVELDPAGIGWVTGFKTEVVDATTDKLLGEEYFCHSQVQLATSARLLVTATGMPEVTFPEGFGIPLAEILEDVDREWRGVSLLGMVLNNHRPDLDKDVKLRFSVDYVAPDDPQADSIRKLYKASVPVIPTDEIIDEDWHRSAAEVLEGDPPRPRRTSLDTPHGKEGHWMVPPGRQVVRQRYRGLIGVPTRVHFGLAHMHNHGRSMKLTDLTTGEVLWQTELEYEDDRVQIREIPAYSSGEGFLLHPDHEYQVESVYLNTSDRPVDAMAVMYLYHHPLGGERIHFPAPTERTTGQMEGEHAH